MAEATPAAAAAVAPKEDAAPPAPAPVAIAEEKSKEEQTSAPGPAQPEAAVAPSSPSKTTKDEATPKPDEASTPIQELWLAAQGNAHPEVWGVTLADPATHVPSQIVLQKYLNANDGDVVKARDQLLKTLEWRAKMKPLELVEKKFSKAKFDGLGYVTTYAESEKEKEIFTWNIYGGVKSIDETFGDLEEFISWRVALMELAIHALDLPSATAPITAASDPYKIFQVHDYKSISFLRQSPRVKAASTETIRVFATAYPELLKEKFFVNVPAIMGFMYGFMKLFVAPKTIKKFHPMSNGANLAREFADSKVAGLGDKLPAEYGGKGADLKTQGSEPAIE
ncbi:CRAL-TRIO domain-containing protein [Xylariomycetidae sp. FL2044]|nr:CRAL-TRIO domain-containing protein [Xylariomycetidae sp. FL2044]